MRLGPITYSSSSTPTAFSYTGGNGTVEIVGSGPGETTLTMPTPPENPGFEIFSLLFLDSSGGGQTISDLTLRRPTPTTMGSDQFRGLEANSATIHDVGVTVTAPSIPINGSSVILSGGTIDDSGVSAPVGVGFPQSVGLAVVGNTRATDTVVAADTAVSHTIGTLTAARLDLTGINGVQEMGGSTTIENSLIDLGDEEDDAIGLDAANLNNNTEAMNIAADSLTIVGSRCRLDRRAGAGGTALRTARTRPSASTTR